MALQKQDENSYNTKPLKAFRLVVHEQIDDFAIGNACFEVIEKIAQSQDLVEDYVLRNCKHAAEWVEANNPLFSDKVDPACLVLSMGEEEQAEAALQYGRLWKEELDDNEVSSPGAIQVYFLQP
ncbi:hypothetical protein GBF38_010550 [Nibea albiflora]|uniref:Uncharacterized protein n=1 Tax=Nibea albiflora TaxID=240163 RepID=A0ACB7F5I4_NIBAL|nr:hypothetical protein GBF38_010550 [Nibea albiflora]